jgi:hypothetical protein
MMMMKLIALQLVKKFPYFMEHGYSVPIHKSLPLDGALSQIKPIHTLILFPQLPF